MLTGLVKGAKRAAVIANSCDLFPENERRPKVDQEIAALKGLGLHATELDLRDFSTQRDIEEAVSVLDLLWVRGGNPFVLRRAMKACGFDLVAPGLLQKDSFVWGGYSAGIAILTPTLHGIEMVDDPHSVPPGYDHAIVWDGLGVIPYALAPHYRSDHPESEAIEKTVQYYIDHHMLFKALKDGQVMIVNGASEQIYD